jgi:L-fuconolactonase
MTRDDGQGRGPATAAPVAVVDAHVHIWDLAARDQAWIPAGSPIRRTFTLAGLRDAIAGCPVEKVILVQVINDADETADLLRQAAAEDLVAGVVGWALLADPAFPQALAALRGTGWLVGVRHQALAELDPAGWLRSPAVQAGLAELDRAGLPFDLIVRPQHFATVAGIARAHPSLQLVLDHLGKPPIATGDLKPWAAGLRELAAEPNVSCKLSGVQTVAAADWKYSDLALFLEVALDAFGPDRMLFGSDWPVATQAASYPQILDVASMACAALSPPERAAVLGGNARRIYRLPPSTPCPQASNSLI